jgi:hypothetical protein
LRIPSGCPQLSRFSLQLCFHFCSGHPGGFSQHSPCIFDGGAATYEAQCYPGHALLLKCEYVGNE